MIFQGITDVSKSNVDCLKRLYKNWDETRGQSADEIMDALAPQVSWGSLARGANEISFTSEKTSQHDVRAYFQGLADAFEMRFFRTDELWRFSHGKAVEFFEYYDTAAVLATMR